MENQLTVNDVITLLGFILFVASSFLFVTGLMHYLAKYTIKRLNNLK